ncbi:MAG: hypothetical protein JW774_03655, partial [Candidatus Aureabacteria bacterium]|nr:hypothetical protein [Candidatus Auribacterota bacterium]
MLIRISLRNLFRQKRRNLLLGMAISIGVMILIVASSFSHGISDTIFNRVVRYVAGQIGVTFNEKSSLFCQIFRDRERMMDLIGGYSKDIIHLEESVGVFCRAVGNKKAESVVVVGVDPKQEISEKLRKEYEQSFQMVEGRFED